MAAHGNNFIRVRLLFDFPPPAVLDCRKCWLLVDLDRCRVVSDLESLIRNKFEFSRRSVLNLFIDDCYLPHTESVHVVRDNDDVRVNVEHVPVFNGHSSCPLTETCRKRQRPADEDGAEEHVKKKKKKKRREESQERIEQHAAGTAKTEEKLKEKKKKNKSPKPAAPVKKTSATKNNPKPSAKPQRASSSDSSSSSEEDPAPKKAAPQKPAPKTPPPAPAAPKVNQNSKKKTPSSSSSETSSDEDQSLKPPPKKLSNSTTPKNSSNPKPPPPSNPAPKPSASAAPPPSDRPAQSSSSESEEEIQLVIKRPLHPAQQLGRGVGGQPPWRGCGRGKARGGAPAEVGRGGGGRGQKNFYFNYSGAEEPTYQSDSLTNTSVVIQNGAENVPKPDYSSMPLLAAPPQVGQKIAFKLLELTENYTPEVSEYKEGKIVSFDSNSKQVELELLHAFQAPVEPGKFDLVYQNPDGSERVEYAVTRDLRVTERWESLLEPRLII